MKPLKENNYINIKQNFLTHTVQMKLSTPEPGIYAQMSDFLTHTVQMKPYTTWYKRIQRTNFLTHTVQMKQMKALHLEWVVLAS